MAISTGTAGFDDDRTCLPNGVQVCYPKRTNKPLFHRLVAQCEAHGIRFIQPDEIQPGALKQRADVVCDALFGFSFKASGSIV